MLEDALDWPGLGLARRLKALALAWRVSTGSRVSSSTSGSGSVVTEVVWSVDSTACQKDSLTRFRLFDFPPRGL